MIRIEFKLIPGLMQAQSSGVIMMTIRNIEMPDYLRLQRVLENFFSQKTFATNSATCNFYIIEPPKIISFFEFLNFYRFKIYQHVTYSDMESWVQEFSYRNFNRILINLEQMTSQELRTFQELLL